MICTCMEGCVYDPNGSNWKIPLQHMYFTRPIKIKKEKKWDKANSFKCMIHGGRGAADFTLAEMSVLIQSKVIVKKVHSNSTENN